MVRWTWMVMLGLALGLPQACGDDDSTPTDVTDTADTTDTGADADAEADVGPDVEADADAVEDDGAPPSGWECPTYGYWVDEGLNEGFSVTVGSVTDARSFEVRLPDVLVDGTETGPWPVVFLWHGYGQTTDDMLTLMTDMEDDPEHPVIAVAPNSLELSLSSSPVGFEWDMILYDEATNRALPFFDQMLACLDEAFDIDEDAVYSVGMSAGAIMTGMLTVARGDVLAATTIFSGALFSDPEQQMCFGTLCTTWPEYAVTNKLPVLWVWGGPTDTYDVIEGLLTIDFNEDALESITYLTGNGHDVIGCEHTGGHVVPPEIEGAQFLEFFFDHPRGTTPDPYATDLPADFPDWCTFHPAE